MNKINYKNFDTLFKNILKGKRKRNIVFFQGIFESIKLSNKPKLLTTSILNIKGIEEITIKLLFWEKNKELYQWLNENIYNSKIDIVKDYKGGQNSGVLFIECNNLDFIELEKLITYHFNSELAINPSFQIKIYISITTNDFIYLNYIYDDRGCRIFQMLKSEIIKN